MNASHSRALECLSTGVGDIIPLGARSALFRRKMSRVRSVLRPPTTDHTDGRGWGGGRLRCGKRQMEGGKQPDRDDLWTYLAFCGRAPMTKYVVCECVVWRGVRGRRGRVCTTGRRHVNESRRFSQPKLDVVRKVSVDRQSVGRPRPATPWDGNAHRSAPLPLYDLNSGPAATRWDWNSNKTGQTHSRHRRRRTMTEAFLWKVERFGEGAFGTCGALNKLVETSIRRENRDGLTESERESERVTSGEVQCWGARVEEERPALTHDGRRGSGARLRFPFVHATLKLKARRRAARPVTKFIR